MEKLAFLNSIKPFMPLLRGNGNYMAGRLNMEYGKYNALLRGQAKYSEDYTRIVDEAKKYWEENKEIIESAELNAEAA